MTSFDSEEIRDHQRWSGKIRKGRSTDHIECPYCFEEMEVFVWSLAGAGKKCRCGAFHTHNGVTIRRKSTEP